MNIELARFLKEVSENAGNECDIREDYSGRGMMGRTTAAVVVDSPTMLIADLIQYFNENLGEMEMENPGGRSSSIIHTYDGMKLPEATDLRIDNMGRQVILY